MTGKEMCEIIASHWKNVYDIEVEPEQIWNYSPRGELFMVYVWYEDATAQKEEISGQSATRRD
jgi:hypothetical protein